MTLRAADMLPMYKLMTLSSRSGCFVVRSTFSYDEWRRRTANEYQRQTTHSLVDNLSKCIKKTTAAVLGIAVNRCSLH